MPPDLVYRMFACDLEAMGIKGGHRCTHEHAAPDHDHSALQPRAEARADGNGTAAPLVEPVTQRAL